jgi:hypothetical protein
LTEKPDIEKSINIFESIVFIIIIILEELTKFGLGVAGLRGRLCSHNWCCFLGSNNWQGF